MDRTRRAFLGVVASGLAGALAGCEGSGGAGRASDAPTTSPEAGTSSPTATANRSPFDGADVVATSPAGH